MIYYSVYYILFTIQQPRHIWPCDRFSRAMKTAQMAIAGTISRTRPGQAGESKPGPGEGGEPVASVVQAGGLAIAASVKMGRKCQQFLTSWLDRSIDGIPVKICRTADPNNSQNAK